MGSTIRRQPIDTRIPSNPKYYFQNITNFGGINITSNPFQANANTASDSLNVYVDEEAALTTRPRLSLKYDLNEITYSDPEYIGVYNLHDGYLLHGKLPHEQYFLMKIYPDGDTDLVGGIRPKNRCVVFEQNNTVYLLDGTQYLAMTKNDGPGYTVAEVEGYIPTTNVGSTNTVKGSDLEDLNLLSDMFKETYIWDGTWDVNDIKTSDTISVENNYIIKQGYSGSSMTATPTRILKSRNENGEVRFLAMRPNTYDRLYLGHFRNDRGIYIEYNALPIPGGYPLTAGGIYGDISEDMNTVAYLFTGEPGGVLINRNNQTYNLKHETLSWLDSMSWGFNIRLSRDGETVVYVESNNVHATDDKVYVSKYNSGEDTYDDIVTISKPNGYNFCGVDITESGLYALVLLQKISSGGTNYGPDAIMIVNIASQSTQTISAPYTQFLPFHAISHSNNKLAIYDKAERSTLYVYDLAAPTTPSKIIKNVNFARFIFSNDDTKIIGASGTNNGWYVLATDTFVSLPLNDVYFPAYPNASTVCLQQVEDAIIGLSVNVTDTFSLSFDFTSLEPRLILTKRLTDKDERYEDWFKNKQLLQKGVMCARFDNNYWIGAKSEIFWSEYNKPNYFPLGNYSEIGDTNSLLTGMNQISDNVLMLYKKRNLYIVTPTTINEKYTYLITETKSVDGNDVLNTPIVTALNEYPTFVNYNGIYTLRQLENVQSSDRIAELLSEPINPKWLAETRETIDSCKTINRLYWTYYVMNYNNPDKPKEWVTKVYLFDNRTMSWFYWELPLKTLDVFVKDDKTTFVSTNGEIFTLETTDIPNRFNPEVLEYYDYGEKLIRWRWKSQILPLNTINYSKKLIETTFILTDTDAIDNYGLNYEFTAYRRAASQTTTTTISDNLNYVQSTTKRTLIPRFNFIQLEIMNIEDDDMFDRNKLRLIGLALKYVLLNYGT